MKKHLYTTISCCCFILIAICSGMLFVGLFSASWDNIKKTPSETIFVLALGLSIPLSFIFGIASFILSIIRKEEYWYIGILAFLISIPGCSFYYEWVMSDIIELLLFQFK